MHLIFPLLLWLPTAFGLEVVPDGNWKTAANVVEFQPFAETSTVRMASGESLRLINLNRFVNSWFLLQSAGHVFNIENPHPQQAVQLEKNGQLSLHVKHQVVSCDILAELTVSAKHDPYMPLCQGRLYLRSQMNGHAESAQWAGLSLRQLARTEITSRLNLSSEEPPAARVRAGGGVIRSGNTGFELIGAGAGMKAGAWYKSANFAGIYLSVMSARQVPADLMQSYSDRVMPMDSYGAGETDSPVVTVAIDLDLYRFGWNNGTEHPGVGWSPRASHRGGAGPDGFSSLAPLAFPGTVNPLEAANAVGVLAGGFERRHSAFKLGQPSLTNRGHHYGFMEKGVVMSTIVPNLATFIVYLDGSIELKTWTLEDNERLPQMRDIRQNGVPLIESTGVPHALVRERTAGNWSATAANQVMSPRTSACTVEADNGKRYLLFSYFSRHSPSGMARVLQAYGCNYAVHLDMNSPRFAYAAFFTLLADGQFKIEHLSTQMTEDSNLNGVRAPRWLLTPSYKDFFYVMKK